jgi:hypothetical protein
MASTAEPATQDDIMPSGRMRAILAETRRGNEVSCAFALTGERLGLALLDRRIAPKQLNDTLRKRAAGKGIELVRGASCYGVATIDPDGNPKIVRLALNKGASSALRQQIRDLIKDAGFKGIAFGDA